MDKLDHLREQLQQEKTQAPNLIRSATPKFAMGYEGRIKIHNREAFNIPAFTVVVLTDDGDPELIYPPEIFEAWRPWNDNEFAGNCAVSMEEILPDAVGWATTRWPCPIMEAHGSNTTCGTKAGSWGLDGTKTGFRAVCMTGGGVNFTWITPAYTGSGGPQGPQGTNPGPPGPQGIAGTNGSPGSAGATGPQGDAGFDGLDGFQGDIGEQGAQGWQGTGAQGYQGRQGWQGWQGKIGYQGNEGIEGEGTQGPQGAGGWPGGIGQFKVVTSTDGYSAVWDFVRGHS